MKRCLFLILISAAAVSPIMADDLPETILDESDSDFSVSGPDPGSIDFLRYTGWSVACGLLTLIGGTLGGAINGVEGFLPGALLCTAVSVSLTLSFTPDRTKAFSFAVIGCAAGWLMCLLPMMTFLE